MGQHAQTQTNAAAKSSARASQVGILQRQCACGQHTIAGEECEECRQQGEGTLQRVAISSPPVNTVPTMVHEVLDSPGQSLDAETRNFMEPGFGHDFSQVRVHADEKAAESARAVNALAYTVGRDVVFGGGQYAPGTSEGRRLLAHELTHVVQQDSHSVLPISTAEEVSISDPSDTSEQVANSTAQAVASGLHVSPHMMVGTISHLLSIQRKQSPGFLDTQQQSPSTKPGTALTIDEFVFNRAELTEKHIKLLDDFAASLLSKLASAPNTIITIVGHTDAPGKEERNLTLGLQRATSVWQYLIKKKVPPGAMRIVSMGATQLLLQSPDKEPRNRRVEIMVEAEAKPAQESKDSTARSETTPKEVKKTIPAPPERKIPADQVNQMGKQPVPPTVQQGGLQPNAGQPNADEKKFHVGLDVSEGTTPLNLRLGKIPQGRERNLVSNDYQLVLVLHDIHKPVYSNDKFTIDLAHDPGVGLGLSLHGPDPDNNRANLTAQVSMDVLDMIFKRNRQDFYELHLTATGAVDLTSKLGGGGNISLQAQPGISNELHLSPNASLFLNLTGTIQYDTKTKDVTYFFGPVTFGFLYHFNP
jgi:outer membrane protein OmpA-like peptidoglycan-associated protein